MRTVGGFGVFAAENEGGPEVTFCGYVLTRHRQTNNGAELWAALEALQGFLVSKLAIVTESQYLQLRVTGRAQHWSSKGWTTTSGKLHVHVPVWEMLFREMPKPRREVKWEHVPAHVNLRGTRWRTDWRWKACARARCGPNKSHNNHHPGQSPRYG